MRCDLHGYELSDAIVEIAYSLKEAKLTEDNIIEIVHGFHHGNVLQSYIQSKKFLIAMEKEGYKLKKIPSKGQGSTIFHIDFIKQ